MQKMPDGPSPNPDFPHAESVVIMVNTPFVGCIGVCPPWGQSISTLLCGVYGGNMDMCIAIRTLVLEDGVAYVQAGAGIVADSVPEAEYQETVNKARALLKAVEIAEGQLL